MLISTNLPGPGTAPPCPPTTMLAAAVDVEWSKNYQIKNGNVPFCYSVVWLPFSVGGGAVELDPGRFWYRSAYVADAAETADLAAEGDTCLASVAGHAALIAGHQFCSDLAVLAAAAAAPGAAVTAARAAWRPRHRQERK